MDFIKILTEDSYISNALRQEVNTQTLGLLGNGEMKQRKDETVGQRNSRLYKGLGAGVAAFNETIKTETGVEGQSFADSLKAGFIRSTLTATVVKITAVLLMFMGTILLIRSNKKNGIRLRKK